MRADLLDHAAADGAVPRFRFAQSQAQLYEFVKQAYPALYAQIRERVREGRWEAFGSTWVEPDCNIPNGESLVRQIVYGRRFFDASSARRATCSGCPTRSATPGRCRRSSGSAASARSSRRSCFGTTRPHSPTTASGGKASTERACWRTTRRSGSRAWSRRQHLAKSWQRYAERGRTPHVMQTFGYGDGGGGVTAGQLDALPMLADAPGLPPSRQSTRAAVLRRAGPRRRAAARLARRAVPRAAPGHLHDPRVDQARQPAGRGRALRHGPALRARRCVPGRWRPRRRGGRRSSRCGSGCSSTSSTTSSPARRSRPPTRTRGATSTQIERGCGDLQRRALERVLPAGSGPGETTFTVFNPLPWDRVEYLEVPVGGSTGRASAPDGAPLPSQRVGGGRTPRVVCEVGVPAMGCAQVVLSPGSARRADTSRATRDLVLDTPLLRVEFDRHGAIDGAGGQAPRPRLRGPR